MTLELRVKTKAVLGKQFIGLIIVARFFKPQKKQLTSEKQTFTINSMNHEGLGVTRVNNKVVFVEGALSGETVQAKQLTNKSKFEKYQTVKVIEQSPFRVTPFCQHYQACGGCQLQHLDTQQQITEKQAAVDKLFEKFANVSDLPWQLPLSSKPTHYRRSGRVAVIYDKKKDTFLVGYRQKQSKKIINIESCDVLVRPWQALFTKIRNLLLDLNAGNTISHLQLCSVESGDYLIVRHTKPLKSKDVAQLQQVCHANNWQLVLNSEKGVFDSQETPYYLLDDYQLKLFFGFDNFIQVNADVNKAMINQALNWLNLTREDKVLDLFCGIGNFTLPLATQCKDVVGVEGVASAIELAKLNAKENQLPNAEFYCQDLTENIKSQDWFNREYSVLLLDPSRMGAFDILTQLKLKRFSRILYVACDPVTMARDSKLLINAGFKVSKISLMNMFPNTSHIETMALFEKEN
ncbi:23S rRNA (uracil(1939)-C(5))-methyltransferase RlmD [Pseudoalteromonas piratica]|uniref:23S rRNA (uracil(1939)-C(5))-methyltransferase RlmD n=1 Tax=Pseudoalteromonas piratica TaxID=1348114 RepID=UPI000AF94B8D|nr:23S rRNA (uracil(1939)-C(5))-methyltransferase RlmD [Pseudoalteromonas piratica]